MITETLMNTKQLTL